METSSIDFAVAAWREEGRWTASALPKRAAASMESLTTALRQLPGEGGVFGLVGVGDEFLLVVRQSGEHSRVLVSDGAAALDWDLAEEAADLAGIEVEDEDLEEFVPIGDLDIFSDFGLDATELMLMCEDESLYPDDHVKTIAKRLGFGGQLSTALKAR